MCGPRHCWTATVRALYNCHTTLCTSKVFILKKIKVLWLTSKQHICVLFFTRKMHFILYTILVISMSWKYAGKFSHRIWKAKTIGYLLVQVTARECTLRGYHLLVYWKFVSQKKYYVATTKYTQCLNVMESPGVFFFKIIIRQEVMHQGHFSLMLGMMINIHSWHVHLTSFLRFAFYNASSAI